MAIDRDIQQQMAEYEKRLQFVETFVQEKIAIEKAERNGPLMEIIDVLRDLRHYNKIETVEQLKKVAHIILPRYGDRYIRTMFTIKDEKGSLDDLIKKYEAQLEK